MNSEVKKLGAYEYELTIQVPKKEVQKEVSKITSEVGQDVSVSGFRKGKAPEDLVIRSVGEDKIKDEVVRSLLSSSLLSALKKENLVPVVNPTVEKIDFDLDKDLTFVTKITTFPEVKVTGYDKIKVNRPEAKKVTDAEVEEVVNNLYKQVENPAERENIMYDAKGEKLTLGQKQTSTPDDSFAQKMGAQNLEDLKKKIKDNLSSEAEVGNERDWETQILEELVKKTKTDIPEGLIEAEIDNILRKIVYDLSSMGMTFEDYLKSQNKQVEDLKKEYRDSAIKTLTAQLALTEIAKQEKFEISDKEVEEALPKEAEGHVHTDSEKAQMHSWLIQRKTLAYLKKSPK